MPQQSLDLATGLLALEAQAAACLPREHYDYFAGGADDEVTLAENVAAFRRLRLRPRILRGAVTDDLSTSLPGAVPGLPILIAPTAFHALAHVDGECATARAAADAEALMIVSMAATKSLEEIAAAMRGRTGWCFWFQFYIQPDRAFTLELVRRAEDAGCRGLVVTVDSPVFGRHVRDLRNGFRELPPGLRCANLRRDGRDDDHPIAFDSTLTWHDIDWLRGITSLPVILKGVAHPADALFAVDHGVDAIMVSNHGGRQLDSVAASIDLLPAVAAAVDGRIPVLLDGGIRRGTDVLKALVLGATAVAIGRPVLWGLAVGGEAGVSAVLRQLASELHDALALAGFRSLHDARGADSTFIMKEAVS